MHDPTPELDYVWPVCGACGRDLWTDELDRQACRPCGDRTLARIAELPALYRQLNTTAMLTKGARQVGTGTSGSRTAPIPPRLDVLDLVAPGGGIAARLRAMEDSWREALGWQIEPDTDGTRVFAWWRINPAEAVKRHAKFLGDNLLWACSSYDSVGQDIDTIRILHAECKALKDDERRPGRVQIGNCPAAVGDEVCWQPLTASAGSHRIHCGACGTRWETLGEWRDLRAAQERVLADAAGVAA